MKGRPMADGGQKGRRRRKEARTKRACRVVPIPEMDKAAFLAQVKQKGARLSRPVIVRGYFDPQAALAISEWQDIESHVTVLPPTQNAALAASYFRRAEKPKMTVREAMERMQGIGNYRPLLTEGERYYVFGGTPLPSATAAAMPWPTAVDNTNGYIASAGVISKCHFDAWAAYLLQVVGKKRWRFFPFTDFPFLYPVFSRTTGIERRCLIDFDAPDLTKYPLFELATCWEGVAGPGDLTFLPFAWWHEAYPLTFSVTLQGRPPVPARRVNNWKWRLRIMHRVYDADSPTRGAAALSSALATSSKIRRQFTLAWLPQTVGVTAASTSGHKS
jgi:hypothetical protein